MIAEMEPKHVKQVATLHCRALPEDLLPSLGRGFLERVLYKGSLDNEFGKTFVFLEGETIGGFITIASDNRRFLRRVMRANIHWIAWYGLTKAVLNPTRLKESWEALMNSLLHQEYADLPEIVVIAVGEELRQRGVAGELIEAAMGYLMAKGLSRCRTKTLRQNLAALIMYEKAGFSASHSERRGEKEYVVLERRISSGDGQVSS